MNVRHPVPDEILLDYVAGCASPGKGLLVETHLAMCDRSLEHFLMLQEVGGALLDTLEAAPLEGVSADAVLARASTGSEGEPAAGRAERPQRRDAVELCGTRLPAPLADTAEALDRRSWRRLGFGVEAALLPCSTPRGRTQLLHARPGIKILPHTHEGEELVLVLRGGFWDRGEYFGPGDVAVSNDAQLHAPVIDDAEPCLCLAVNEGPIRFVGPTGWLLNRINRF